MPEDSLDLRPPSVMGTEMEYQAVPDTGTPLKANSPLHSKAALAVVDAVYHLPLVMGPQLIRTHGRSYKEHVHGWIHNGSRVYPDLQTTPEVSTPECGRPDVLVAYEEAGAHILQMALPEAQHIAGFKIRLFKKTSDGHGNTWGCHENYCIPRFLYDEIVKERRFITTQAVLATFLIVRQVLCGSGKVGVENYDQSVVFQLTERFDHLDEFRNDHTTFSRPLIQERLEPLANGEVWQRLHYIMGDANMCQVSTYLKTGLTALFLLLLSEGGNEPYELPVFGPRQDDYPNIARRLSWDGEMSHRFPVQMVRRDHWSSESQDRSAPDILECYLERLGRYVEERPFANPEDRRVYRDVVNRAMRALRCIQERRIHELFGVLDWPTKKVLLDRLLHSGGKTWEQAKLDDGLRRRMRAYVNYAYTSLDPEHSLYWRLRRQGHMTNIVSDEQVRRAFSKPPQTRAELRTLVADKWVGALKRLNWNEVKIHVRNGVRTVTLPDPMLAITPHAAETIDGNDDCRQMERELRKYLQGHMGRIREGEGNA